MPTSSSCYAFRPSVCYEPSLSQNDYILLYQLNAERMKLAKPDALILHPGPINRGTEITPDVADGPRSAVLEQVTNGVSVRMAILYLLMTGATAGTHPALEGKQRILSEGICPCF